MSRLSTHVALVAALSLSLTGLAACQATSPSAQNVPSHTANSPVKEKAQRWDTAALKRRASQFKLNSVGDILFEAGTGVSMWYDTESEDEEDYYRTDSYNGIVIPDARWVFYRDWTFEHNHYSSDSNVISFEIPDDGGYIGLLEYAYSSIVDRSSPIPYVAFNVLLASNDSDYSKIYSDNSPSPTEVRHFEFDLFPGEHHLLIEVYSTESDLNGHSAKLTVRRRQENSPRISLSAEEAFSPNSDGSKDTNPISVNAFSSGWELSVDGHPGVLGGLPTDPSIKTFQWDGKVGGQPLPDGKYTLRLKSGVQEDTKEVTIDTVAPTVKVTIDGQEFPDVIDNMLPKIEAVLDDELAGIDDASSVFKLEFSTRQDGMQPVVYDQAKQFTAGSKTFTYQVPTEEDAVLFGGDQSVTLGVEDKAGNRTEVTRPFAVGAHTLWAGIPDTSTAYRVGRYRTLAIAEAPGEPEALEKYKRDPNYRILRLDPDKVMSREIPEKEARPITEEGEGRRVFPNPLRVGSWAALFLVVNQVSGDKRIFHFDEEYESISAAIKRGKPKTIKIGTQYNPLGEPIPIGDIVIDNDTYDHLGQEGGHTEVGPNSLIKGIHLLKRSRSFDGELELWRPSRKDGNPSDQQFFLAYKWKGNLYAIILDKGSKRQMEYSVTTAYGAARDKGDTKWRPIEYQWSYIAMKVAEFYEDNNVNRKKYSGTDKVLSKKFGFSQPSPPYPHWTLGVIADDTVKPYKVDIFKHKALADPDRSIPKLNKKLIPGK